MSQRQDETPMVKIKGILSTDKDAAGQAIMFPRKRGQVEVMIYEIEPGAHLPLHKHPFPRMGYVLSGMLRVTIAETGSSLIYVEGDFALEAVDKWHEAESIGQEATRLLVIDLVDPGTQNVILRETSGLLY